MNRSDQQTRTDGAASPSAEDGCADAPSSDHGDRLRQAVLDALPAQVAVLDAEGYIVAVNKAWRQFAEENDGAAELAHGIGINYLSVCRAVMDHDADQARLAADGIASVLERRESSFVLEYPCHGPTIQRWMALTASPLDDESRGAIIVHMNITQRKLAEGAARRARESMAQAARLNAVGILAASLIHELTQPLSAAAFFSGTAVSLLEQNDPRPDKLPEVLAGVDGQIKRASATVQRLREFLRKQEMRMQPVAIDDIVMQAMELLRWFAADRNVRVHVANRLPGLQVMGDTVQLEQVIVNLMCNSIQAIDNAGMTRRWVSIHLARVESIEADQGIAADLGQQTAAVEASGTAGAKMALGPPRGGKAVQVTVRDTGPGLRQTNAEQLFNIFTSTKDSGLGLGLAISRDIVESHGGALWAESAPCEGACFHFTLPTINAGDS